MSPKIFCLMSFFLFALPDVTFCNSNQYQVQIKAIQFKGLRNIQAEQVSPHLPITIGQTFSQENIDSLLKALYASGFFETIKLLEEAGTLIFEVKERPVIKQITINQKAQIPDKMLEQLLERSNIKVGEFFSESAFQAFKKELQSFYSLQGKYKNNINTARTFHEQNSQVSLKIELPSHQGTLRFGDIYIVGNTAFKTQALLDCLPVTNSVWKGFLTNKTLVCHPSVQQIALGELKNFYQNKGYFDIEVKTQNTSITPDQTAAYWVIEVKEGPLYRIGEYKVIGPHKLSQKELKDLIHITSKEVYSKESITKTEKALKAKFGLLSKIEIIPSVNQKDHIIDFTISIDPGKEVYVRKLHITGNQFIQDQAIRRLCQQQENALLSTEAIQASENRLNRSGFSKSPIFILPTKISNDQVDLHLQIDEKDSPSETKIIPGSLSFGNGSLDASTAATFGNIFGSGKKLDLRASKVANDYFLSFLYHNPYATIDNVRKTFKFVFQSSNPGLLLKEHTKRFMQKVYSNNPKSLSTVVPPTETTNAVDVTPNATIEEESRFSKSINNVFDSIFNWIRIENLLFGTSNFDSEQADSKKSKSAQLPEYNTNEIIAKFDYGIPINRSHDLWNFNIETKLLELRLPSSVDQQSQELKSFLDNYGKNLFHVRAATSFDRSQLEVSTFSFPEKGFTNKIKLTLTSLWTKEWNWWPYVKLDVNGAAFHRFEFSVKQAMNVGMRWKIGYGFGLRNNGESLPFFENYYSGQIKGFAYNSLGQKNSLDQQLGGNFLFNGSLMVFAPKPFRGDNFKISTFCDIGALESVTIFQQLNNTFSPKLSIGFALDVVLPVPVIGRLPFAVYVAQPIWYKDEDNTQPFSIIFGNTFL